MSKKLPLFALRDQLVFPGTNEHLLVGREPTVKALNEAKEKNLNLFACLLQDRDGLVENKASLHSVGCVVKFYNYYRAEDGVYKVSLSGLERARLLNLHSDGACNEASVEILREVFLPEAKRQAVLDKLQKALRPYTIGQRSKPEALFLLESMQRNVAGQKDLEISRLVDRIVADSKADHGEKQSLLEELDVETRIEKTIQLLKSAQFEKPKAKSLQEFAGFRVGDSLVYPNAGVCLLVAIEEVPNEKGSPEMCFILKTRRGDDLVIRTSFSRVLRAPITPEDFDRLMSVLFSKDDIDPKFRDTITGIQAAVASNSMETQIRYVKALSRAQPGSGGNLWKSRFFLSQMMLDELSHVSGKTQEEIREMIEKKLPMDMRAPVQKIEPLEMPDYLSGLGEEFQFLGEIEVENNALSVGDPQYMETLEEFSVEEADSEGGPCLKLKVENGRYALVAKLDEEEELPNDSFFAIHEKFFNSKNLRSVFKKLREVGVVWVETGTVAMSSASDPGKKEIFEALVNAPENQLVGSHAAWVRTGGDGAFGVWAAKSGAATDIVKVDMK